MGSFRSQPDLVKHTITKNGAQNITFAVTHMCGIPFLIQDGEFIWKTLTSTNHHLTTQGTQSLVFSMGMEVLICLFRS
jgi:hypothetical protein